MILGVAWYVIVGLLRVSGWIDWVLRIPVFEMLWFKDGDIGSLEHDLQQEWLVWKTQHSIQKSTTGPTQVMNGTTKPVRNTN